MAVYQQEKQHGKHLSQEEGTRSLQQKFFIRAMVPEQASGRVGIIPPSPTHQPTQAPYSPLGNTPGPPLFELRCSSEQVGELASPPPTHQLLKHHTPPWAIPLAPPIRATVLERASGRVGITPANSPAPQAPYSPLGNTPGPPLLACPTAGPKSHAWRRPASSSPRTRPPSTSHSSASSSQAATR